MQTLVFIVTYRMRSGEPQGTTTKYTRQAADSLCNDIEGMGGIAVCTEELQDIPEARDVNKLTWSDDNGL